MIETLERVVALNIFGVLVQCGDVFFRPRRRRAEEIGRKVVTEAELSLKSRQVWIPLIGTALSALVFLGWYFYSGQDDLKIRIAMVQGQLASMASLATIGSIDERLKLLNSIDGRLRAVELKLQAQTQTQPQSAPIAPQNQK